MRKIIKAGKNYYVSADRDYSQRLHISNHLLGLSKDGNLVNEWIPNLNLSYSPNSISDKKSVIDMEEAYYLECYDTTFNFTSSSLTLHKISDAFTGEVIVTFSHTSHPDCCGESLIVLDYDNLKSSTFNLEFIYVILSHFRKRNSTIGHNFSFTPNVYFNGTKANSFNIEERKLFKNNRCTKINDSLYMKQYGPSDEDEYFNTNIYLVNFYKNIKLHL